MNRRLLGASLYQAVNFAGFIVFAHYSGNFLGELDDGEHLYWVFTAFAYPIIMLIISTLVKQVRRVLPVIAVASTLVGIYGLIPTAPNFISPLVNLSSGMVFCYFLALSSMLMLFVSSQEVLFNVMRDIISGISLKDACIVGGSYSIAGVAGAISIFFGRYGWLNPAMIFSYVLPVGLLFYYMFVKFQSRPEGALEADHGLRKGTIMKKDKSHRFKMVFFFIGETLSLLLVVLVAGMASPDSYMVELRWYFWMGLIMATGVSMAVLAINIRNFKPELEENILEFIIPMQKQWMITTLVAWGSATVVTCLELFVEWYHGTPMGSLIDGIVAGIGLGTYTLLAFVLNVGRRKWIPVLVGFTLSFMIILGTYLAPMVDQDVLNIIEDYLFVFPVLFMAFIAIQLLSLFLSLKKMQEQGNQ
ncbi:hypothetical protein GF325_00635 [Candidatus Bathyarchaeota archaeon]|nr:hypothetical protein [Candidatus Bathyarchaeota archaeon]